MTSLLSLYKYDKAQKKLKRTHIVETNSITNKIQMRVAKEYNKLIDNV